MEIVGSIPTIGSFRPSAGRLIVVLFGKDYAMKRWISGMFSLLLCGCLSIPLIAMTGCQNPMTAFTAEFSQIAQMIADKVDEQGLLEEWSSNLDANVQNPGVGAGVDIRIMGFVRLIRTNGEIDMSTEGTGASKLAPIERDAILEILMRPGLSLEQQLIMMDQLGIPRAMPPGEDG